MDRERLVRAWPVLLVAQSIALSIVLSWPTVAHLMTHAVGYADADGPKHIWTLWWMRREFWHGESGLHTSLINFPEGMDLFPIEPLNGLISLVCPLPTVLLSNLLALSHLTMLGVSAGWLGWLLSGRKLGALVAGAMAEGTAFSAFVLHVGVGELRQLWWIPLGLGCLVRARETLAWKWFLALAGVLAGAALSCFYHGLFLGLATAIWALTTLWPKPRLLAGYALAAGLSVAIVYPVVTTFATSFGGSGAPMPVFDDRGMVVTTYKGAAMELDQLVTPRSGERTGADRQTFAYTGGRYVGWVTLLLAVAGLAAAPKKALPWLAVTGASTVLSLGSVLWMRGALVTHSGMNYVLPLAYLNDELGKIAEPINFPARFIAPGMIALAMMAALATRWRWTALAVPLALLDIGANDLVPWPRKNFALPDVSSFAQAPGTGAIADLAAAWNPDPESRLAAIAVQVATGRPVSGVPIERLDTWAHSGTDWVRALHLMREFVTNQPSRVALEYRRDAWLLRKRGFDSVLLSGNNATDHSGDSMILTEAFGKPVRSGRVALWPVPEITATADEQSTWQADFDTALRSLTIGNTGPPNPGENAGSPPSPN